MVTFVLLAQKQSLLFPDKKKNAQDVQMLPNGEKRAMHYGQKTTDNTVISTNHVGKLI